MLAPSFYPTHSIPDPQRQCWSYLLWAVFLVIVPVFIEAPLVRLAPSLCLFVAVGLLGLSRHYDNSFLWGFALTWLCGAIYWGWFRFDPAWHLPLEALALPWAVWGWTKSWYRVGAHFYIGSLSGTALTDGYFYVNGLIPHWRGLMQNEADPELLRPILQEAIKLVATSWGAFTTISLAAILLAIALQFITRLDPARWSLAGAILGTILVDLSFYFTSVRAISI